MKNTGKLLLVLAFLMATSIAFAQDADKAGGLEGLEQITLPSADGDSVNVGEAIKRNDFTLIVLYRGVW